MADLTIRQVENRLLEVHGLLAGAQQYLARVRDDEVRAEEAHTLAKAEAMMRAPSVERGSFTVAERDAWVERQTGETRAKLRAAEAVRKSAEDNLRVVRDQASVVQSLAALLRAEMGMGGSSQPSVA